MHQLTTLGAKAALTETAAIATKVTFKLANRGAVVVTKALPFEPVAQY